MPNVIGDASVQQVLYKTVAMRRHGDQITALTNRGSSDLLARIAARQERFGFDPVGNQRFARLLEVDAVDSHFLRLTQVELLHVPRGPAVSDVDEHDRRAGEVRELL